MALSIAISGYGRMGKESEKMALSRGHVICAKADNNNDWLTKKEMIRKADVVIDFSFPETVVSNIKKCFEWNLPVVVGTTGWYDHLEEVRELCAKKDQTLLFASNFSIGVNIFFEINKKLAQLMNNYKDYNVSIREIHHTEKLDAPSGTAIALANDIIRFLEHKEHWVKSLAQTDDELGIESLRVENVTGTHIITYESEIDSIEIKHNAKNRSGFALGAILAAEWIADKKGFYTFNDMLKL